MNSAISLARDMRIARVFPRKTSASPDDDLAFFGPPDLIQLYELAEKIREVHISVAFTYDIPRAEAFAECWQVFGVPVKMGGPAYNAPGGDFIPGMYVRKGFVISSRGCPNRCWFCDVPKREGYRLRELPVVDGWNILDDNLLACSEGHIRAVFDMLRRQTERILFTGGLEAKLLKPWHVELLQSVKTERMFFAYDTEDDYAPLLDAGKMLMEAGLTRRKLRCYVLIGFPGDTMGKAETRLKKAWNAGFMPFAMLYRDEAGKTDAQWRHFQREWARPPIVYRKMMKECG